MKYTYTFFVAFILFAFASCSTPTSDNGGTSSSPNTSNGNARNSNSNSGIKYTIHNNNEGKKAKFGDFLTLHMQYTTQNDSIIFSSFDKPKPLSFKFQDNLFKGILNGGLQEMAAGDSATFWVPGDSLYSQNLPNFLKKGDQIKYTIALQKIQSQEEYQTERNAARDQQLAVDGKQISSYLSKNKLKMEKTASNLYHNISKAGNSTKAQNNQIAKANYKVSLLDGTVIEEEKNGNLQLSRQVRGVREALGLLGKGGKGKFVIPSTMAYGDRQRGKIPSNAVLVYDIEVLDIVDNKPKPVKK